MLQGRMRSALGVDLPLRVVFGAPDLASLASEIDGRGPEAGGEQSTIPPRAPGEPTLPLSFGQQRFWFLEQWQPDTPLYHISGALRLTGELDVAVLRRSVRAVADRHESLRTTLVDCGGERRQLIGPSGSVRLPVIDLAALADERRATLARRLVQSAAETPFRMDGGPLWRAVLLRLSPTEHQLALCLHHLIADGQSLTLLLAELGEDYGKRRAGETVVRPPLPVQYGDYAVWQQKWLKSDRMKRELGYWRERLSGLPDVTLPTERPRPAVQTYDSAVHEVDLPVAVALGLPNLAQRANATPFMALFAAAAVALGQARELDEVVVGTPVANRTRPELEGVIGYVANTVVLRLGLDGCATFSDLLARARTVCLEAYDHAEVPFEQVVQDLRPDRKASHLPLFQAWFVVQDELQVAETFDGLAVEPVGATPRLARYDLRLELRRSAAGLRLVCEYKTDLFTAAGIEGLARQLTTVLEEAVAAPGLRLDELTGRLRAAEEQRQAEVAQAAAAYSAGAVKRRRRRAQDTGPVTS
ncbi:hypothetical protein C2142_30325 [Streptomyces sp. CB01881]|nr:hypothetical protein C2142_30325 [Streptomyces sp. CB01881]